MQATWRTIQLTAAITALTIAVAGAQTKITPPKNKYTPQQDVEVGREARRRQLIEGAQAVGMVQRDHRAQNQGSNRSRLGLARPCS